MVAERLVGSAEKAIAEILSAHRMAYKSHWDYTHQRLASMCTCGAVVDYALPAHQAGLVMECIAGIAFTPEDVANG